MQEQPLPFHLHNNLSGMHWPTLGELYFPQLVTEVKHERGSPSTIWKHKDIQEQMQPKLFLKDLRD
jgi:hypothetical protein